MQKIINVRASQGSLNSKLSEYLNDGWRIVSTTKGSEWTRLLNTYKWTVVLEKDDAPANTETALTDELERAHKMYESGAITEDEYKQLKEKILSK